MYKWFAEKKGVEAAELLLNSIQSNDADRNTALFAYLDVMAVEYGFEQALEKVSLLRPYVKDAEKKIKIPFYEKVYSLVINDIESKIIELEVMINFLGDSLEKTNIDRMNSRLNSLKELQKLLKNEYAATCLDIKALYGLDLF